MAAIDSPPPRLSASLLDELPDGTLVRLVAAGSDDAFAALDRRYRRRLVAHARRYVIGADDAEDAVQETMVRALRALRGRGSRPEAVGPWLHAIARNCALDVTTARRRHRVVELDDHQHPVAEDAQAAVERRQGVRRLLADVDALPDSQRSALVLRELEGRSYADIADELDVTVPAVKSLLVRARAGLKRARERRGGALAGWLPLPALSRLAERLAAVWEPVTSSATAKLACAAAVVATSVPVAAPGPRAPEPPERPAEAQTAQPQRAAAAPARRTTPARQPKRAKARPASVAELAALRSDCADGTIDGRPSRAALTAALRAANAKGAAYGDCRDALQAALIRSG